MENKVIAKEYVDKNYVDKKEYEKLKENFGKILHKHLILRNAIVITYGEDALEELEKLVELGG